MTKSITKAAKSVAHATKELLAPHRSDKIGIFIKLDRSVIEWFKRSGPGYQRRINEVLKRFIDAVEDESPTATKRDALRLKKAQELYEKYYEQCFWYMKPDLIVTQKDLPQIIKGLKTYGGRDGYLEAAKLCL